MIFNQIVNINGGSEPRITRIAAVNRSTGEEIPSAYDESTGTMTIPFRTCSLKVCVENFPTGGSVCFNTRGMNYTRYTNSEGFALININNPVGADTGELFLPPIDEAQTHGWVPSPGDLCNGYVKLNLVTTEA